jgi:hypothetical protein
MCAKPDVENVRNVVLQKIGRNVVNFQKMEAMLKFVLAFGEVNGPLSEIRGQVADRVMAFSRMPMGRLVEEAGRGLFRTSPPDVSVPASSTEITVTVSFSLEGGNDEAKVWKSAMREVVEERNRLIHQMLAGFDLSSKQSCEDLCMALDAQRDRFDSEYRHLQSLVQTIRESFQELEQHLDDRTIAIAADPESNNGV